MTSVSEIPVAHTPPGGYGHEMPPPVLAGCREPLVAGAPDLRGTWKVVDAFTSEADARKGEASPDFKGPEEEYMALFGEMTFTDLRDPLFD